MWGSMSTAYEALSAEMKTFMDGLTVRHDNSSFIKGMEKKMGAEAAAPLTDKLREQYPAVIHPLIRTHPENGRKTIFFGGGFMREIVELTKPESDALLAFLARHIEEPVFHTRDERSTVHRGLSDHFPREREVRRCVIDGDRPV